MQNIIIILLTAILAAGCANFEEDARSQGLLPSKEDVELYNKCMREAWNVVGVGPNKYLDHPESQAYLNRYNNYVAQCVEAHKKDGK